MVFYNFKLPVVKNTTKLDYKMEESQLRVNQGGYIVGPVMLSIFCHKSA